jgi:diguanylate cyclase (GGDEF)-like protein/PAS domain S-box-containing protein
VAYSLRDLSESANTLLKNIDKSIDKVDGAIELQVLSESMENMRKEIQNDRHELKLYSEIINQNVIISRTDLKGKIVYVSEAFCDISGYSQEELIGKNHNIVRHPDMPKSLYEELWQSIQNDNTWSGEIKNLRKDGDEYWVKATITPWIDKDGKKIGYIGIRQDIGDKKRVEELAITDRLTQIYNRIKLDEVLASEIAKANRYEYSFSTILIDIDHFKSVNDTYGHQVGDSVLKECASLVKSNIRETDIFGRWGGEEFLIICINTDLDSAVIVANKLRESIDSYDFSVVGHKSASFGVSEYLKDDNEESIVKRADDALYRAKESGRNRVEC